MTASRAPLTKSDWAMISAGYKETFGCKFGGSANPVDDTRFVQGWTAARAQFAAERAELIAALEPFAKEAGMWGDQVPDDHAPVYVEPGKRDARYYGSHSKFSVGDLRSARSLLSKIKGAA